jgi:DnaA family protein
MSLSQSFIKLNHVNDYSIDAFIVGECNQKAFNWANQWPSWDNNRFVCIIGEKGAGKTHILQLLKTKSNGTWINKDHLYGDPRDFIHTNKLYILDNADKILDERWLFDFYNLVFEKKAFWVISGTSDLNNWQGTLKDWQSRLKSFLIFKMDLPDDLTLSRVLQKELNDLGLQLDDNALKYLITRIDRSFEYVQSIAQKLDKITASKQRKLTIPALKDFLH